MFEYSGLEKQLNVLSRGFMQHSGRSVYGGGAGGDLNCGGLAQVSEENVCM